MPGLKRTNMKGVIAQSDHMSAKPFPQITAVIVVGDCVRMQCISGLCVCVSEGK